MGLLGADSSWGGFLEVSSRDQSDIGIVARNFRLQNGVTDLRIESYRESGALSDHPTIEDWWGKHSSYLSAKVNVPPHSVRQPVTDIRLASPECPESFRDIPPDSPYLDVTPNYDLIHVVATERLSAEIDESVEEIARVAEECIATTPDRRKADLRSDNERQLDDFLARWARGNDNRPVFAALWEDIAERDLFGETPGEDADGWANTLRDILGLAHLTPDPGTAGIDIIVLKYPVEVTARLDALGTDQRPLIPPTVLDFSFNPAFCPAPDGEPCGWIVDLSQNVPPVLRELLHLPAVWKSRHVWRTGRITEPVEPDKVIKARQWHIVTLQDEGFSGFAEETDHDLL